MQTLVPARRTFALAATCFLMVLYGCGESSPTEPGPADDSPAFLRIVTSTDGLLIDPDGYGVAVDGGSPQATAVDDTRLVQVEPGAHTIALSGQAANCTPHGNTEVQLTVAAGDTATVELSVTCFRDPIAFGRLIDQGAGWQVYVMDASGGTAVELTSTPGMDNNFLTTVGSAFNPARTHIALQSNDDDDGLGEYDVYVMALNKSEVFHRAMPGPEFQPAWSPDGTMIVFAGYEWGGESEIYVASPDLSSVEHITPGGTTWDGSPVFSPDGSRIAFVRETDIYVMNPDGSGAENISDPTGTRPAGTMDILVGWSRDGSRILYKRWAEPPVDEAELWVVDADGSNATALTDKTSWGASAAFGPDGRIYYTYCADNFCETQDVWVMNADGSGAAALTTSGVEAFTGSFNATTTFDGPAPAGGALLTVQNPLAENGAIYRMAPDGSERTQLVSGLLDYVRWD